MSFRRYEILLPIRYNNGQPVEDEKFDLVVEELTEEFGGVTVNPEELRGVWLQQGQRFEDLNVRVVVEVEDTLQASDFFVRCKEALKERFRQIEIRMVSYEVRIT